MVGYRECSTCTYKPRYKFWVYCGLSSDSFPFVSHRKNGNNDCIHWVPNKWEKLNIIVWSIVRCILYVWFGK